jgi:hypothetical protein
MISRSYGPRLHGSREETEVCPIPRTKLLLSPYPHPHLSKLVFQTCEIVFEQKATVTVRQSNRVSVRGSKRLLWGLLSPRSSILADSPDVGILPRRSLGVAPIF